MKGKNDPTAFSLLKSKINGPVRYVKDNENLSLIADHAKYIYKKVEQESTVNIEMIKQEIEDDKLDEYNDDEEVENQYQNIIIN